MNSNCAFEDVVAFHGHTCPGLAIGYRMVLAGLAALSDSRAEDEELVAIVENDACGIDAVQLLSGCTFGKGNLVFRDFGKSVYTLYSRRTGEGVRVAWKDPQAPVDIPDDRVARVDWILQALEEDLMSLQAVNIDAPPLARIHESILCDRCQERTMSTRIRSIGAQQVCMPCWEKENTTPSL
jgi:formylmethanofuran dehydrogenase subunit E